MSGRGDREQVLQALRRPGAGGLARAHPGAHPAPPLPGGWSAFAERLAAVGGQAHGPLPAARLGTEVAALARRRAATGRIVVAPEARALLGEGPWETAAAGVAPHALRDVSVAVIRGEVGVAESGAVAVVGRDPAHRALAFLCQHLVLLLDAGAVVADLHGAFAELPPARLADSHCVWISGPSKTADIEQTLVYGAHGPLSCDVIGVGAEG